MITSLTTKRLKTNYQTIHKHDSVFVFNIKINKDLQSPENIKFGI